jgi:indole-3-acetate monooxygenase
MKQGYSMQELRENCFNAEVFPPAILDWITRENLWNLWVPKSYGGLEIPFAEGLQKLKSLARIDGSLGWTITLCSGANFFIGNLKKEVAGEIFNSLNSPICFGGSGGAFGTAEKIGNQYKISGKWKYATGASYLTHFTLNAKILQDGKELENPDGTPLILSFVIPAENVTIIEDWKSMGLKATVTHSFEVKEEIIGEKYSFLYNHTYLPQPIFRIHFSVFADLTLWVNYIGMAEHFLEEARTFLSSEKLIKLEKVVIAANSEIASLSEEIEQIIQSEDDFKEVFIQNTHKTAVDSVRALSAGIIAVYPFLGVAASREDSQLNQIFRDFFTAIQHHIFSDGR